MGKYLIKASYSIDGIKGVLKEGGSSRVDAIQQSLDGLGGSVESAYFAFGESDVYVIIDVPDNATVAALTATAIASGAVSRCETVVLLTPAEIDEAMSKSVSFRPPGR